MVLADLNTTFPIVAGDLTIVKDMFDSAVTVAVPVGFAIMATSMGIRFVPKWIKRLAK